VAGSNRFERKLESLVSGAFARAFKGAVEPVELAAALKREVDNTARILSRDRRLVPNSFTIELSPEDFRRLSEYGRTLQHELANELREHADIQRYTFSGPIEIRLTERPELPTGKAEVRSATVGTPAQPYPSPNEPPAPPLQAVQPPQQQVPRPSGPVQVNVEVHGRIRPVNPPGVVIGRGTDADIQVNDPGVSRRHAEIRLMPDGPSGVRAVVVDLGSTNGTLVNGRRTSEAELADGAIIKIGTTELTLRISSSPAPAPPSGPTTSPFPPPTNPGPGPVPNPGPPPGYGQAPGQGPRGQNPGYGGGPAQGLGPGQQPGYGPGPQSSGNPYRRPDAGGSDVPPSWR
jgi:hypothetical protein